MVDKIKWNSFSLAMKMANIGSEVLRMAALAERNDEEGVKKSAERALELIDLSVEGEQRGRSKTEFLRLRDIVADYYIGQHNFQTSKNDFNSYFLPFALLARNNF